MTKIDPGKLKVNDEILFKGVSGLERGTVKSRPYRGNLSTEVTVFAPDRGDDGETITLRFYAPGNARPRKVEVTNR